MHSYLVSCLRGVERTKWKAGEVVCPDMDRLGG
jgi:hypothetical protein